MGIDNMILTSDDSAKQVKRFFVSIKKNLFF
jgi:hypothetical protein